MSLNKNISPYFNDFAEDKLHLAVMVKPGVALQARELNELQSIISNQIQRFGDNIFKDGAMVIPGQITLDTSFEYVRLQALNNTQIGELDPTSPQNLGNTVIVYGTTGLKAQVIKLITAVGSDPDTLFVKYLNSGGSGVTAGTIKRFTTNEKLSFTPSGATIAQVENSALPSGLGSATSIGRGVYYVFGYFVLVESQTIVLDKYNAAPSYRVGLTINETFVTSDDDPALNDNATGSPNYAAPGADRYVINLQLDSRTLTSVEDTDFIELLRVDNGIITKMVTSTAYSIIEDEMARRTEEANGDFTVNPFKIDVREHLLDTTHPLGIYTPVQGGDITKLAVGLEPGIAYVKGYRLQNLVTNYLPIAKARNTATTHNGITRAFLGNYILIDRAFGFPTYDNLVQIQLYDAPISANGSSAGSQIGTAYVRGFEYESGTISNGATTFPYPIYQLYLFNITLNAGKTFDDVRSYYVASGNVGANAATGNIVSEVVLQNATGVFAVSDVLTDGINSEKVVSYDSATGVARLQPITGTIPIATIVSNGTFSARLASRTKQFNTSQNVLIYPLPQKVISTIRAADNSINTSYTIKKTFQNTTSNGSITYTAGTNEAFGPFTVSEYSLTVEDATGNAGTIINTSAANVLFGPGETTVTFNNIPNGTHTVKLSAPVFRQIAQERTKTLTDNALSPLVVTAPAAATISLAKPDIYQIVSITEIPISGPNVDLTTQYSLDNGQRDNFYDLGSISLMNGLPGPAITSALHIVFKYFTHSSGDYFSIDSYNNFDGTENWYSNIPTYGQFLLRDCFDFRPVINNNGTTFTGDAPHGLVQANTDILADFQFYLSRIDKIYLDYQGNFKDISGIPSLTPTPPNDPTNGMVLYVITLNPYTFTNKDLSLQTIDNRGYDMHHIGLLAERISKLEYYVSLNLLEQETANLTIVDSSTGLNRFKNGFIVDPFTSSNIADTGDGDYRVSMDFSAGIMRPTYNAKNIPLVIAASNSSNFEFNTLKPNSPLVTNKYTEAAIITQPYATGVENINPYAIYSWIGSILLNPPSDTWFNTTRLPDVTITDAGQYNSVVAALTPGGSLGTVWNEWKTDWTGVKQTTSQTIGNTTTPPTQISPNTPPGFGNWSYAQQQAWFAQQEGQPVASIVSTQAVTTTTLTTTNTLQSRTGVKSTVIPQVSSTVVNDSIVNTGITPYIRSRYVKFTAKRLKPFTRFFTFFDTIAVSTYCKPVGSTTGLSDDPSTNLGDALITNGLGEISGWFLIPPKDGNDSLQFKTGNRVLRLTDDENNSVTASSFADGNYLAQGIIQTEQNTITSTITAEVERTSVTDTRSLVSTSTSSSTAIQTTSVPTNYIDPLAQSFLINFTDENNSSPAGVFLSKMDLYFLTADPTLPVTVQIREMQNGSPTQTVVPYSEIQMYPFIGPTLPPVLAANTVYTSNDATIASTAVFTAPVFLRNGVEYCFVLMANSNQYQVYTAQLGQPMINSDRIVSQQPYAGVLFESKNASTWTPNQTEDIKFTIYRCVFDTNSTGAIVYFSNDNVPAVTLGPLPFEFSKGSNLIRIIHPKHGKPNGASVTITIPQSQAAANYNGIAATVITPNITLTSDGFATYAVTNIDLNTYTITLPVSSTATSSGRTGPDGVIATDDVAMDVLYPLINQLLFSGTQINWTIKTTTTQSVGGTQEAFVKDSGFGNIQINENNYMVSPRLIASSLNESLLIPGTFAFDKKSLVFQANLVTNSSAVSGVIDTTRLAAITIQNLINNCSPSNSNIPNFDDAQENSVSGVDIAFDSTTNSITWSSSNFSNFTPFSYLTIAGSSTLSNNNVFPNLALITSVDLVNKIIVIDPTTLQLSTHSAGDSIVVNLYDNFINEQAPQGGTTPAKYMCKQVILQNPANSLTVYLTALWPRSAEIDVYYKILPPYSQNPWYSLKWTLMNLSGNFSNSNTFQDYTWQADDIGDFSAVAVKVVLKTTDSTQIPQCKDFRVIALGT